jgi:hypothetical protein
MIFIKVTLSGNSSLYFSVDSEALRLICFLSSHGEDGPVFVIYFVLLVMNRCISCVNFIAAKVTTRFFLYDMHELNTVTCQRIARQRVGKEVPAKTDYW